MIRIWWLRRKRWRTVLDARPRDHAFLVVKAEKIPPQPPGSWLDIDPHSIEVVGPPMVGVCATCGVDLEELVRRGESGHACWGKERS